MKEHDYVLDGTNIVKEIYHMSSMFLGEENVTLYYYYDESGVSGYNDEFKIALRVGTKPYYINQITGERRYDYHFMRQTDTGQWAEKHGTSGASILHKRGQTPTTISWDLDYLIGYYDSPIIYYAVGK